jgi:hypothetical protein
VDQHCGFSVDARSKRRRKHDAKSHNDHIDSSSGHGDRPCWRVWRRCNPNKRDDGQRGGRHELANEDRVLLLQKWPPLLLRRPREAQLPRLEKRFRSLLKSSRSEAVPLSAAPVAQGALGRTLSATRSCCEIPGSHKRSGNFRKIRWPMRRACRRGRQPMAMTPRDQAMLTAFSCKIFDITELKPLFDSQPVQPSNAEERASCSTALPDLAR